MTGLSPDEQALAETYGPPAPYSDYKRGERLRYRLDGGQECSGEILWVAAASMIGSQQIGLRYIVASDGPAHDGQTLSGLDIVFPHEIIQDASL